MTVQLGAATPRQSGGILPNALKQGATSVEKSDIDPSSKVGPKNKQGSLTVVGTGIKTTGQLTLETIAWLEQADSVLYVVGDPIAEAVIKRLNPPGAVSMAGYHEERQSRLYAYKPMVERILRSVRSGAKT